VGVFKNAIDAHTVSCFRMTTENRFHHMTVFSRRLTGKNSAKGSAYESFYQHFFVAKSALKVQCFLQQVN